MLARVRFRRVTACTGLLLLASLLTACGEERDLAPAAPRSWPADFHRGFTLGGWSRDDYRSPSVPAQLDALRALGVERVALTPRWFQQERSSTAIAPDPTASPSDDSLARVVALARERGLEVMLKPQVDLHGPGWRGEIAFEREEDWAAWFASYADFIGHHARLAERFGAALLCVGVELDGTRHRDADWRRIVAGVRSQYAGPLVYAANWNRERDVTWWDTLDFAGIDAYWPLADDAGATSQEMAAAWRRHLPGLRRFAERVGKPVLFTEIGYRSVRGAGVEPWEWEDAGEVSLAEQASAYRATFAALQDEPWLRGLYWWQWRTAPPDDPAGDTGYTPQGKPAADVVADHYRRAAGTVHGDDPGARSR